MGGRGRERRRKTEMYNFLCHNSGNIKTALSSVETTDSRTLPATDSLAFSLVFRFLPFYLPLLCRSRPLYTFHRVEVSTKFLFTTVAYDSACNDGFDFPVDISLNCNK